MSAADVEVVRRWLAALSASPAVIRASAAECWDADADYYPVRKWPEAQPCHGFQEVSRFFAEVPDTWANFEWEIRDIIEVGDDRLMVCATLHGDGRGSAVRVEGDIYTCFWMRHGRFFRVEDHLTLRGALHGLGLQAETLEAAGLAE